MLETGAVVVPACGFVCAADAAAAMLGFAAGG